MVKPVLNIEDVELQPRPAAVAPTGQAADRFDAKLRYLAISTKLSPEIAEYPDSGKFGVLAEYPPGPDGEPRGFRFVGRESQSIDYWEGE